MFTPRDRHLSHTPRQGTRPAPSCCGAHTPLPQTTGEKSPRARARLPHANALPHPIPCQHVRGAQARVLLYSYVHRYISIRLVNKTKQHSLQLCTYIYIKPYEYCIHPSARCSVLLFLFLLVNVSIVSRFTFLFLAEPPLPAQPCATIEKNGLRLLAVRWQVLRAAAALRCHNGYAPSPTLP